MHVRPETAGADGQARRAQVRDNGLVQRLTGLWPRGADKAGPAPLTRVGQQRELRDSQNLAPDLSHIQIELALGVVEDAQAGDRSSATAP